MTAKYHINLFWSEPDGAWVADVPDLQSCSAFGDTPAEALAEVETAMGRCQAWTCSASCRKSASGPIRAPSGERKAWSH